MNALMDPKKWFSGGFVQFPSDDGLCAAFAQEEPSHDAWPRQAVNKWSFQQTKCLTIDSISVCITVYVYVGTSNIHI